MSRRLHSTSSSRCRMCSMFSVLVGYLKEKTTSTPRASAYSAKWLPTNPVTPVIRMRMPISPSRSSIRQFRLAHNVAQRDQKTVATITRYPIRPSDRASRGPDVVCGFNAAHDVSGRARLDPRDPDGLPDQGLVSRRRRSVALPVGLLVLQAGVPDVPSVLDRARLLPARVPDTVSHRRGRDSPARGAPRPVHRVDPDLQRPVGAVVRARRVRHVSPGAVPLPRPCRRVLLWSALHVLLVSDAARPRAPAVADGVVSRPTVRALAVQGRRAADDEALRGRRGRAGGKRRGLVVLHDRSLDLPRR